MNNFSHILFIFTFILLNLEASSQNPEKHVFISCVGEYQKTENHVLIPNDSLSLARTIENYKSVLFQKGFLEAQPSEIRISNDSVFIQFQSGKIYQWDTIIYKNKNLKIYNQKELEEVIDIELTNLENNGFPFSRIEAKQMIKGQDIQGELVLHKGPLVLFDSIVIQGDSSINKSHVQNLINIRPGSPYSEEKVRNIYDIILNSGYFNSPGKVQVLFKKDKAIIYVPLKKKQASFFSGIVGFQPNENSQTILTGQANIILKNALNQGEYIQTKWDRIRNGTQNLFVEAQIPYLFKSKLGLDISVEIYRQDSSTNRLISDYGLSYNFMPNFKLSAGISSARNNTNLSANNNLKNTNFSGVYTGIQYSSLDYYLNPRKGSLLLGRVKYGNRKNEEEVNSQTTAKFHFQHFIPLFKKSTLNTFGIAYGNFSKELFVNELDQLGGLGSIRGVDQRSIFTEKWATIGVEYRFLFEKNSNFLVFVEQNGYSPLESENSKIDFLRSIGLGFSVGTKGGIFNFNYSIAQLNNSSFQIRNAKINFGFISEF